MKEGLVDPSQHPFKMCQKPFTQESGLLDTMARIVGGVYLQGPFWSPSLEVALLQKYIRPARKPYSVEHPKPETDVVHPTPPPPPLSSGPVAFRASGRYILLS